MSDSPDSETTLTAFSDTDEETLSTPESDDIDDGSTSSSDAYGTPPWVIRLLTNAIGGPFDLDPAAGAEADSCTIAHTRFTEADDGLQRDWGTAANHSIYLNPPYSDPYPWLQRLTAHVDSTREDAADFAVALTKADTSTAWFHDFIVESATAVGFLEQRLSFVGGADDASFPNALSVFGDAPEALYEAIDTTAALFTTVEIGAAAEQQRLDDLITDGGAMAAFPIQTGPTASSSNSPADCRSVDFVSPYDSLEISLDTSSIAGRDLPEQVIVTAMPDGRTFEPATGTIRLQLTGTTDTGDDVCVNIRSTATNAMTLEVAIAVGMREWQLAPVKEIQLIDRPDAPPAVPSPAAVHK